MLLLLILNGKWLGMIAALLFSHTPHQKCKENHLRDEKPPCLHRDKKNWGHIHTLLPIIKAILFVACLRGGHSSGIEHFTVAKKCNSKTCCCSTILDFLFLFNTNELASISFLNSWKIRIYSS